LEWREKGRDEIGSWRRERERKRKIIERKGERLEERDGEFRRRKGRGGEGAASALGEEEKKEKRKEKRRKKKKRREEKGREGKGKKEKKNKRKKKESDGRGMVTGPMWGRCGRQVIGWGKRKGKKERNEKISKNNNIIIMSGNIDCSRKFSKIPRGEKYHPKK